MYIKYDIQEERYSFIISNQGNEHKYMYKTVVLTMGCLGKKVETKPNTERALPSGYYSTTNFNLNTRKGHEGQHDLAHVLEVVANHQICKQRCGD